MENPCKKNADQKVYNLKSSIPAEESEKLEKIDLTDVACKKKDGCGGQNDKKMSPDLLVSFVTFTLN